MEQAKRSPHDTLHDEGGQDRARSSFERSRHDAQAAIDRSRNLRQAITFQRVLRELQRRRPKDS